MKLVIQTQCINLFRWPGASCQGYFFNPSFVRCFKCPNKTLLWGLCPSSQPREEGAWEDRPMKHYWYSSLPSKQYQRMQLLEGEWVENANLLTHQPEITTNYHIKIASYAFWLPFINFCRLCMLVCFLGESVLGIFSGGRKWEMIRFLLWRRTNRLPL